MHIVLMFCLLILLSACGSRPAVSVTGCDQAPPKKFNSIRVNEGQRNFILALPADYRADQPHSLVFAFHGRTNSNVKVRGYYDLERHAQRPTIFVYPSGLAQARRWSEPKDKADALRDYAFFDALLNAVEQRYCIDPQRVYLVGHSLGAWFSTSLACARGRQVRAVAALGGSLSASRCTGPVAAMLLHNPNDRLAPFQGSVKARDHFLALNQVDPHASVLPKHSLNCRRYGAAKAYNPVVWCPHQRDHTWRGKYYPHNWPRGTGQFMMAFFESLPD